MPKENASQQTEALPKKRQRRSSEEIVNLLIDAACDEFENNGYEKTTTAAIAQKAGVTEALIFSNFGSKAQLFHDAIFKPLNQHFLQFQSLHPVDPADSEGLRLGTQQYILELQQFIGRHSEMLRSVVATQLYASNEVQELSRIEGLHDYFSRTAAIATTRLAEKPKLPPKLMTRISFATILACSLFQDWLFPEGLASEDEISTAVSDFIMDGINANADRDA